MFTLRTTSSTSSALRSSLVPRSFIFASSATVSSCSSHPSRCCPSLAAHSLTRSYGNRSSSSGASRYYDEYRDRFNENQRRYEEDLAEDQEEDDYDNNNYRSSKKRKPLRPNYLRYLGLRAERRQMETLPREEIAGPLGPAYEITRPATQHLGMKFHDWLQLQIDEHFQRYRKIAPKLRSQHLARLIRTGVVRRKIVPENVKVDLESLFPQPSDSSTADSPSPPSSTPSVALDPPDTKLSLSHRMCAHDVIRFPTWMKQADRYGVNENDGYGDEEADQQQIKLSLSQSERQELTDCILYEDDDMLIFNKPNGLAVQPGTSSDRHLVGMLWYLEETDSTRRKKRLAQNATVSSTSSVASSQPKSSIAPSSLATLPPPLPLYRLVHRLDASTSGCLVLAKNRRTASLLCELFRKNATEEDEVVMDDEENGEGRTFDAAAVEKAKYRQKPARQRRGKKQEPISHSIVPNTVATEALTTYTPLVWSIPPSSSITSSTPPFIQKQYLAVVHGVPERKEGSLVSPGNEGQVCHSSYRVLHSSVMPIASSVSASASSTTPSTSTPSFTFTVLQLQPHTGRKRQLRLHCHFELGCTIVGENLYQIDEENRSTEKQQEMLEKREKELMRGMKWNGPALPLFLHAQSIHLYHPALNGGRLLSITAPQPEIFQHLRACMTKHWV